MFFGIVENIMVFGHIKCYNLYLIKIEFGFGLVSVCLYSRTNLIAEKFLRSAVRESGRLAVNSQDLRKAM